MQAKTNSNKMIAKSSKKLGKDERIVNYFVINKKINICKIICCQKSHSI